MRHSCAARATRPARAYLAAARTRRAEVARRARQRRHRIGRAVMTCRALHRSKHIAVAAAGTRGRGALRDITRTAGADIKTTRTDSKLAENTVVDTEQAKDTWRTLSRCTVRESKACSSRILMSHSQGLDLARRIVLLAACSEGLRLQCTASNATGTQRADYISKLRNTTGTTNSGSCRSGILTSSIAWGAISIQTTKG